MKSLGLFLNRYRIQHLQLNCLLDMESKINVAEFCKKHQVERHLLNYQFQKGAITRDEDKLFDEDLMLELLDLKKDDNVEIQHLKNQVQSLKEEVELLNDNNTKQAKKIIEIKSIIIETAMLIGLSAVPQAKNLAPTLSALTKLIYQSKKIKDIDLDNQIDDAAKK